MPDYSDIFCASVDNIIKARLADIKFDTTDVYTILDDSKKDDGIYTVGNDSISFEALSTAKYRKGESVYVNIPNGDWNQQKFIVGKQTTESTTPINYQDPLDSFIDMTGNMAAAESTKTTGLIANAPYVIKSDIDYRPYQNRIIYEWTANTEEGKLPFVGYTRLGLQGSFQSWVNNFKCVSGEYGLKVSIAAETDPAVEEGKPIGDPVQTIYEVYLNTNDFYGNPYNFESFTQQEKVFDVSGIGQIVGIQIVFYEQTGSFLDNDGTPIPYFTSMDLDSGDETPIAPNLFMTDLFVSLGYDANAFDSETALIYTFQPQVCNVKPEKAADNNRKIMLRWIHQDDNKFISITQENSLEYEVRWYRYSIGNSSADGYSGAFWQYFAKEKHDVEGNHYFRSVDRSGEEKVESWIKSADEEAMAKWDAVDDDWSRWNRENADAQLPEEFFTTYLIPDTSIAYERIKAIILYDNKVVRSNVLEFQVNSEVVNKPTLDAMFALGLECKDNSNGNYLIYNQGNRLLETKDSSIDRILKATFKSITESERHDLLEAEEIRWYVPVNSTMIVCTPDMNTHLTLQTSKDNPTGIVDGYYVFVNTYLDNEENTDPDKPADTGNNYNIEKYNYLNYRIRSYNTAQYHNNTIRCEVINNRVTFTASKNFTFGQAGTTGTDFSFILDFDDGKTGIPVEDDGEVLTVSAYLYDYNNELQDISQRDITWSIENNNGCFGLSNINGEGGGGPTNRREIKWVGERSFGTLENPIVQAPIIHAILPKKSNDNNGWGDYDLHAYLPLPVKKNKNYKYIIGADVVSYDSAGQPDYYRNPYYIYQLIDKIDEETQEVTTTIENIPDVVWSSENYTKDEVEHGYTHKVVIKPVYKNGELIEGKQTYSLSALNPYIENACKNISVVCQQSVTTTDEEGNETTIQEILWIQPILSIQNRYPSGTLNKWDGALEINEKKNYVLAAQIAAGRKEDDNTFSGVMMGAWERGTNGNEITDTTGLYGFHHGAMSYAFKDDGTGFIGRDTGGRINFDGTSGTLTSNRYACNAGGMRIDLQDGIIEMIAPNGTNDFHLVLDENGNKVGQTITTNYDANKVLGITLDVTQDKTPFHIGKLFSVDWDGTLVATNGEFSGKITANDGTIAGWEINSTSLSKNGVSLNSDTGTIHGARVEAGTLASNSGNRIDLEGYLTVGDGQLGQLSSNFGTIQNELGIGLQYEGTYTTEVKATGRNAGLKASGQVDSNPYVGYYSSFINVEPHSISINAGYDNSDGTSDGTGLLILRASRMVFDADNIEGIYARFK